MKKGDVRVRKGTTQTIIILINYCPVEEGHIG